MTSNAIALSRASSRLREIVLRFAREYNADNPGALTQDVMEWWTAEVLPLILEADRDRG
ncbi:MAG TPA: hypothetical protein VGH54_21355 [Mycobacterium sp.]|jgi:hypothetical protein|uniref:hypothetical protein n=1 Tax=Mycobacterium sp. TaxID=1785 RepID=UPI002F3E6051